MVISLNVWNVFTMKYVKSFSQQSFNAGSKFQILVRKQVQSRQNMKSLSFNKFFTSKVTREASKVFNFTKSFSVKNNFSKKLWA